VLVSRFPTELNVGEVSAQIFWKLFSADLQDMLKGTSLHPVSVFLIIGILIVDLVTQKASVDFYINKY